jgi:hypothetical protein
VLSSEPVRTRVPSRENVTTETEAECPSETAKSQAGAVAAPHQSATRSLDEALPWIPKIQSPCLFYQILPRSEKQTQRMDISAPF